MIILGTRAQGGADRVSHILLGTGPKERTYYVRVGGSCTAPEPFWELEGMRCTLQQQLQTQTSGCRQDPLYFSLQRQVIDIYRSATSSLGETRLKQLVFERNEGLLSFHQNIHRNFSWY